jgi:hypothetical protein
MCTRYTAKRRQLSQRKKNVREPWVTFQINLFGMIYLGIRKLSTYKIYFYLEADSCHPQKRHLL